MKKLKRALNYLRLNLRHKDFLEKYYTLKKNQYLSYSDNKKRELSKLNNLLTHAYNHVPYYNKLFKELDIVNEDGKVMLLNTEELSKIPILTKDIIRLEKDNIYSDDITQRESYKNSSGGSTGEPLSFMQDAKYAMSNRLSTQLAFSWNGCEPYDDKIIIWGAERDTFEGAKPLKSILKDFYQNVLTLNSFSLSEKDMREYIKILNKQQPTLIKAYAQSIFEIAKFAKKNKIYVKKQNAIHLAAGTVYDSMKDLIEEVFGCKAYNYYGSREVGSIASECSEQNGLHIMMEHTIVEILNENNEPCKYGEQGEIVVTTLNNYSMPLIRYKIGDIGVLQEFTECKCGCSYPKLEKVVGRTTDIFKTLTGSVVVPEYFIHLIGVVNNKGSIKLFQVVQEALDKIIVKIVKDGEIKEEEILDIEEKIKLVMGKECSVIFEFVEEIAKTPTGKHRYTISNINKG